MLRLILAWAFCALAFGCRPAREAAWFTLRHVEPGQLEAGVPLRVLGEGFSPGQGCALRLRGRTYRPGLASLATSVQLEARARSDEEVTTLIDEPALAALGASGSFEGELLLAFRARAGDGEVVGSLPVRLDLATTSTAGHAGDHRLRERGRCMLEFAGIDAAEGEPLLSGLVVAHARPGSPAALLGLEPRDVIEGAGGVTVHSLLDFAPPLDARRIALRVRRPGRAQRLELGLPLYGFDAQALGVDLARLSTLFAGLLLCVLFLSPLPSPAPAIARALERLRSGPRFALGAWNGVSEGIAPDKRRARANRAAMPLALSVLGVLLIRVAPTDWLAVRALSLHLGFCALSVTLGLLCEAGSLGTRMRAGLTLTARMLAMGLLIACACALFGARSFDALVDGQGPWPWHWALLQKPALLCAFPLYVALAGELGAGTSGPLAQSSARRALELRQVACNVVLCALGTVIFAGGWQSPLQPESVDVKLIGAACFVVKTWGFAGLVSVTRHLGWGKNVRPRAMALGCAATIGLTVLWLWLEPSAAVELALGRALAASLSLFALITGLRASSLAAAARASVSASRSESA